MKTNKKLNKKTGTWVAVMILVMIAVVACGAASAKGDGKGSGPMRPIEYDPQRSLAPLIKKVSPAVVNIKATHTSHSEQEMRNPSSLFEFFFGGPRHRMMPVPERQQRAMGSGFIIDQSGLVVTNHHVVENADEIEVQLDDERTFNAKLVGSDERTDLALLKLENARNLPTVKFGNSDKLNVGDRVVAIGNPFGLDHTVTSGIVSAKERVIGAGPYDDFIQTDASINPGNSGGPLFNLRGEVIGINTAIVPRGQGIGFAIPSSLAGSLIDTLRSEGRVIRGWLGIVPQPLDKELARAFGVKNKEGALVANVQPDSPADKAGLKAGDVIIKMGKKKLKNARQIYTDVATLKPGQIVRFVILRDGRKKTLSVKMGKRPDDIEESNSQVAKESAPGNLGIRVVPLDRRARKQLDAEDITSGVVVFRVDPGSPAALSVRNGDIIVEVNRDKVSGVESFSKLTSTSKKGDDLLLLIYRRGAWIYTVIRM